MLVSGMVVAAVGRWQAESRKRAVVLAFRVGRIVVAGGIGADMLGRRRVVASSECHL